MPEVKQQILTRTQKQNCYRKFYLTCLTSLPEVITGNHSWKSYPEVKPEVKAEAKPELSICLCHLWDQETEDTETDEQLQR